MARKKPHVKKTNPLPAPDGLSAEARKHWAWLVPQLLALGIVGRLDKGILAVYCESWAMWSMATKKLAVDGVTATSARSGLERVSPWWRIQADAERQMRSAAAELGLTPAARNRLQIVPSPPPSEFFP
jgi:P27 family predicted phage terminase small subunit